MTTLRRNKDLPASYLLGPYAARDYHARPVSLQLGLPIPLPPWSTSTPMDRFSFPRSATEVARDLRFRFNDLAISQREGYHPPRRSSDYARSSRHSRCLGSGRADTTARWEIDSDRRRNDLRDLPNILMSSAPGFIHVVSGLGEMSSDDNMELIPLTIPSAATWRPSP